MRPRLWASSLLVVGVGLIASATWHLVTIGASGSPLHWLIDLVVIGGAGVGYVYSSYWHTIHSVARSRGRMIAAWIVGSGLLFASLGVIALHNGTRQISPVDLLEVLHITASVGLLAGLLVGTLHARSINNAAAAARAEAEAAALAAEQERLEQLTDVLRHYILNGVNIISGYASSLHSAVPEDDRSALTKIDDRAEMIATLIKHIGSLQERDQSVTAARLDTAIESAIADVEPRPGVTIDTPGDAPTVQTGELFGDALYLFCDAITATIEAGGRLTITCRQSEQTVVLSFTATPATLPEPVEEALFEPISSGVGLEFYLAHRLFDKYGEIQLRENTGDDLCFDLVLPIDP